MSATSTEIACQTCGATLRVEGHQRTARCPYCASSSVVERPASEERPDPTFVLGFVLDEEHAQSAIRGWLQRRSVFCDSRFRQAAAENLRGVYVPAYLYSARSHSRYRASIGENYTETETYTTTVNGKSETRTRRVTRTEWRALEGQHASWILDKVVTASEGVPNEELESVEPFDLRALRRYDAALLSGWYAEDPTLEPERCRALAHQETLQHLDRSLAAFLPGDSHQNLEHETQLEDESLHLVLMPVWVAAVRAREEGPSVRLLVNGQTGKVAGKVPLSGAKIALAVFGVLVVIALLMFLLVQSGAIS